MVHTANREDLLTIAELQKALDQARKDVGEAESQKPALPAAELLRVHQTAYRAWVELERAKPQSEKLAGFATGGAN